MSEYTVTPTEDSIKRMSSSGRFNLYDSWNEMKSGAWVLFVNQVPTSVDLRGSSVEDLEWELEDLGFDGAEVDTLVGYVHFDTEMNKQLKRVGLFKFFLICSAIFSILNCASSSSLDNSFSSECFLFTPNPLA